MTTEQAQELYTKIETAYPKYCDKPLQILEVLNHFFGEDYVDMQIPSLPLIFERAVDNTREMFFNLNLPALQNRVSINDLINDEVQDLLNELTPNIIQTGLNSFTIPIIIYFPTVTISNESDHSRELTDLYVKLEINSNGTIESNFKLNRGSYTLQEIISDYMHSHINGISRNPYEFLNPCLGKGPIKDTQLILNTSFDIDKWSLFCVELSKYITTESIIGVPYRRINNIGNFGTALVPKFTYESFLLPNLYTTIMKEFITDFINSKKLKFNYVNGNYTISMNTIEFTLTISNFFIEWYNKKIHTNKNFPLLQDLLLDNVLQKVFIKEDGIYSTKSPYNSRNIKDLPVCYFKDKLIKVVIKPEKTLDKNISIILSISFIKYIYNVIIRVLNYNYGKTNTGTRAHKLLY